jgi:methylase of polypeptide subunit release factors
MPTPIPATQLAPNPAVIHWIENDLPCTAHWRSESGMPSPRRVVIADDRTTADAAYRLACEGTAMLWRGDFQNARQLLQAMARRCDRKIHKAANTPLDAFNFHRQAQSQRARTLAMLLMPFDSGHTLPLRRAPDVQAACNEAYGLADEPYVASLRELLGLIGAHEWRKAGVEIAALANRIHPHYGVFAPVRGEYVGLVAETPLPAKKMAFDIGTGTGVLAAVLAQRGMQHVIGTDQDPRALACAQENIHRLGLNSTIKVIHADLFPPGRADLIVCNPPWLPARPSSPIEYAMYDPDSRMLRGFLDGLAAHLEVNGEGWLILSDLAEHLGLRTRAALLEWISAAGLTVLGRTDIRPIHPRARDASDPLHAARSAELTSLWRLGAGRIGTA